MKKYIMPVCVGFIIMTILFSGCSDSAVPADNDESTESTTEYKEITEDETSIKPKIDYEYTERLLGKWSGEKGIVIFNEDNKFTAFNEDSAEYNGNYSVVASEDGNIGISFALDETNIKSYTAKFSSADELTFTDEFGVRTKLSRGG